MNNLGPDCKVGQLFHNKWAYSISLMSVEVRLRMALYVSVVEAKELDIDQE